MPPNLASAGHQSLPQPLIPETTYNTITIDGDLSDWSTDELMEIDNGAGFYLTWDSDNLYFALSNVNLIDAGTFFVYFDTITGGTTTSYDWIGIHNLPFDADYALGADSNSRNGIFVYTGATWDVTPLENGTFYIGSAGNTNSEFLIPRSTLGNPAAIYLLAFVQNQENDGVSASWPTPNPATNTDSETFTHPYHFPSLVDGITPQDSILATHIILNEVQTKGDERVELYNPTADPVDISGWIITGQIETFNTTIPDSTILAPGSYYEVAPETGTFSNDGDVVTLTDSGAVVVDSVGFGTRGGAPIAWNLRSLQRTPNGTDFDDDARDWNMVNLEPTFNLPNNAPEVLLGSSVILNEIDVYPASGNDKVELYNPTGTSITVTEFGLSDGDTFDLLDYSGVITVPANGWLVLEETVTWNASMDFSSADVVYLFRDDGVRIDQIGWYNEFEDDTYQRIGDGEGPNDGYDWVSSGGGITWFDLPSTLGSSNYIADVQTSKTGPDIITAGETITYTIEYSNSGFAPSQNVEIIDALPTGVSYLSDTSSLPCVACYPGATGTLIWTLGTLNHSDAGSFDLIGLVESGLTAGTELENNISITTTTNDSNLSNNDDQVSTSVSTLDLTVEKDGPSYAIPGNSIEYTINVINTGFEAAANVVVTDTLPASITYISDDSGFTPSNPSTGVYVWGVGNVPADTSFSFHLLVSIASDAVEGTELINTVEVSTTTPNDPPGNNSTQHSTTLITPIHDIQGVSHLSPLNGESVHTAGIVTVVRSSAFYMQDPNADADDATSEAIYVYVGASIGLSVGDEVLVSGTITEYRIGSTATNLTLTEITGPTITLLSSGNPLPSPVILGTGGRIPPAAVIDDDATGDVEISGTFDPLTDGIDFYESLEGMLVQVNDAIAVAATNNYGEIAVVGDSGVNAGALSPRGGLVIQDGDLNPERILVDDTIITSEPKIVTGSVFDAPIIGVMDYTFGNFKLFNTTPLSVLGNTLPHEVSTLTAEEDQITVATYNVENLDPTDVDRFAALATQIVDHMLSPDIIALQEIQDNNGATNDGTVDASLTYQTLIDAIQTAGGPVYDWRDIAPVDLADGGEPGGNIRVGFLFRTDRGLSFVDRPGGDAISSTTVSMGDNGVELSYSPGRIDPLNVAFLDSRKPLAGEFLFNGHTLIVIANHLNSKGGDEPLFGRYQPPTLSSEVQRIAQATVINGFVQDVLSLDLHANVIVLGDLNDFQFAPPMDTLIGSELNLLTMLLPAEDRYTYNYDGNAQALDHILVSDALLPVAEYDIVHINSEYLDNTRPTDHDPAITRIALPSTLEISKTIDLPSTILPGSVVTYTITLSNMGYDTVYNVELTDVLPTGITFGDWIENQGAIHADGIITWEGSVVENLTFIFTATINLDVEYGTNITNTASYEYLGGSGSDQIDFSVQTLHRLILPILLRNAVP